MSVQWMSWVFEHAEVTGSKRLVLLSLANHANGEGVCWPKVDQIAKEARLSRRSVEEAMRGLVADGVVEREDRRGRGRPNIYRLNPEGLSGEEDSGESPSPENHRPENPEDSAQNPEGSSGTIEPSVEPSLEPSALARPEPPMLTLVVADDSSPPATDGYSAEFEAWWKEYPRKVAKHAAWLAYKRARKLATPDELMTGMQAAVQCWRAERRRDKHIPHAATWLNERRWRDDVDADASRPESRGREGVRRFLEAEGLDPALIEADSG